MALQLWEATLYFSAFCVVLSYFFPSRTKKHPLIPYPPGPLPKPFIGNALDVPIKKQWVIFRKMSEKYKSNTIHLCAFNTHIVVLHAAEDIEELLERKSSIYSSRPPSPVLTMLGMDRMTFALPYGSTFRKHRRMFEEVLKKDVIPLYHHILAGKVHLLLGQLLHEPSGFEQHCNMLGSSISTATTFGYDIMPGQSKDRFVRSAEFVATASVDLVLPGKTLIAAFPFLRHIPPWFPGAATQSLGDQVRRAVASYRSGPFEYVKRGRISGTADDCIVKRLLERHEMNKGSYEDEEILKDAISTLYLGAVETMQMLQIDFILAMTLHPIEQKKAQDEIDEVLGSGRLPTFGDRAVLPYVEAFYREVLRWRPLLPLGFAHSTSEDDIFQGYRIPKGSIILPNVWAITRDHKTYPEPESFRPERFIKEDGTLVDDTMSYMFGYGRRICPGRHMADLAMWLMMASVLAMFNISKAKDENGIEIDVHADAFSDGITIHPLPFQCSIVPRSEQAETLIHNAADAALQNLKGLSES